MSEWSAKANDDLYRLFRDKYRAMKEERRTDRRNFSAVWNKYLSSYSVTVLRDERASFPKNRRLPVYYASFLNLMDIVNYDNGSVAGRVMILNPDRQGQFLLVPREVAERVLFLGMI